MSGPRPATYYDADKKLCQRCGEVKPRDQFNRNRGRAQSHCIPCRNYPEDGASFILIALAALIGSNLGRYKVTVAEWEAIFNEQGRACAICRATEPRGQGWHTDHSHDTGAVRGILCHDCNVALGYYEKIILPKFVAFDAWRRK